MSTHRRKGYCHRSNLTCIVLLLFMCAQFNFITSMSLERINVERNDLQQTNNNNNKPSLTTNAAEDLVLDDDRRLTPVPTQDEQVADMYVLLPALDKNTIETDPNVPDGETDMLMVESNDAPLVALVEPEQTEADATTILPDNSEIEHILSSESVDTNKNVQTVSVETLVSDESLSNSENENENVSTINENETMNVLNVTAENNKNIDTVLSTISDVVAEAQSLMEAEQMGVQFETTAASNFQIENAPEITESPPLELTTESIEIEKLAAETTEGVFESETLTEIESTVQPEIELLAATTETINVDTDTIIVDQDKLNIENVEATTELSANVEIVTENVEKVDKLESPNVDELDKQQLIEIETETEAAENIQEQAIEEEEEVAKEEATLSMTTEFTPTNESEIDIELQTTENSAAIALDEEILPLQTVPEETTVTPAVIMLQNDSVIDSVMSYVNATIMNQQQLQQILQQDNIEQSFRPSLRSYEGAQVWRIVIQSDRDRKLADELRTKYDGQLWKEVKQEIDYLLKPQVLALAEHHLRANNLSRVVLIDNLQHIIDVENPPADEIAQLQNRKGHRLTWQAYHRLEDIHGFFDYLAKTYPDICTVETIGYSLEKRPLKILKISNGNLENPGIWIDGGMHAREWVSPASVTYIANQIVEGWDDLPAYMKNVNWHLHAVANPDGYEYTHTTDRLWRKNMRSHGRDCPGVDLNRNFGYMWGGKGTSANPCSQIFRGNKAFSEPETFYISKYISNFPRNTFSGYLSFHSYGQYILYPWGYDYMLTQDKADLDRVARQAATAITKSTGVKYTVGASATTLYPAAGGSDDWAKGFAGIKYTYTVEMGDTGRYGFVLPAKYIETNGKDAYTFAETVARAITQDNMRRRRSF